MPGYLLHAGATIRCAHPNGRAEPTRSDPRVRVAGQPVVTKPSPHNVTGCLHESGGAPSPCQVAHWKSAATRVRVGGQPVLLQDSQAVCVPNGTGVTIEKTQTRVRGA
jgi:hypothetical protein